MTVEMYKSGDFNRSSPIQMVSFHSGKKKLDSKAELECSDAFLSAIFGIFGKFRFVFLLPKVGIFFSRFFQEKFSSRKKSFFKNIFCYVEAKFPKDSKNRT